MSYFRRYQAGDHVAVWQELAALGAAVRDPTVLADATAVAQATMERVAKNIDTLVTRLRAHGYQFGVYPDGSNIPYPPAPLLPPSAEAEADFIELQSLAGAVPLSLSEFWNVVGAVSLSGRMPAEWPGYADPLIVYPPQSGLVEYRDWPEDAGPLLFPLAPDVLHKDNVSGGAPYSIMLPDPSADALVRDEWHNVAFVPYLRMAILEWHGFPGLSPLSPQEPWRARAPCEATTAWLKELAHDLVAF